MEAVDVVQAQEAVLGLAALPEHREDEARQSRGLVVQDAVGREVHDPIAGELGAHGGGAAGVEIDRRSVVPSGAILTMESASCRVRGRG